MASFGIRLLAFCMLVMITNINSAAAFTINSCDGAQRSDTFAAATFLDRNLSAMIANMTFLSNAQQAEVLRKWPRLKIRCRERGRCRNSGVGGHAHGGPGNAVRICYDNLVDLGGQTLCDLGSIIVHEMGHAHGFPIFRDHNTPSANTRANDLVYQMGNSALAFCTAAGAAGTFANNALSGATRVALGQSCGRNPDCASGTCQGGTCVCDEDRDCLNANDTCIKRPTRPNLCAPTGLAEGAACFRDRQCLSGRCRDARNTCR